MGAALSVHPRAGIPEHMYTTTHRRDRTRVCARPMLAGGMRPGELHTWCFDFRGGDKWLSRSCASVMFSVIFELVLIFHLPVASVVTAVAVALGG